MADERKRDDFPLREGIPIACVQYRARPGDEGRCLREPGKEIDCRYSRKNRTASGNPWLSSIAVRSSVGRTSGISCSRDRLPNRLRPLDSRMICRQLASLTVDHVGSELAFMQVNEGRHGAIHQDAKLSRQSAQQLLRDRCASPVFVQSAEPPRPALHWGACRSTGEGSCSATSAYPAGRAPLADVS